MKKITKISLVVASLLLLAQNAFAAAAVFANPIAAQTVGDVLMSLMGYLKSIAGIIAVIFIIIGGIMYMISGGDKDMMERGKKTLLYAIGGAAIVVAAPTFLREILTILGGNASFIGGLSLQQIAVNVLRLLLSIIGILAIISIMIGATWMLTAAGDKDRYELGKKTVMYALIGIIIAVGSLIIVQQVSSIVGGGF